MTLQNERLKYKQLENQIAETRSAIKNKSEVISPELSTDLNRYLLAVTKIISHHL